MNTVEPTQRETAKQIERIHNSFLEEIEIERAKSAYQPKETHYVDGKIVDITEAEALELRRSGHTVELYY